MCTMDLGIVLFDVFEAVFYLFKVVDHCGRGSIDADNTIAVNGIFKLAVTLGEIVRIKAVLC